MACHEDIFYCVFASDKMRVAGARGGRFGVLNILNGNKQQKRVYTTPLGSKVCRLSACTLKLSTSSFLSLGVKHFILWIQMGKGTKLRNRRVEWGSGRWNKIRQPIEFKS